MDSDGTQDVRGRHAPPAPRPATEAQAPPMPTRAPDTPPAGAPPAPPRSPVADWLDQPRPAAEPGIWRLGYRLPKPARTAERLTPVTVAGMLIPALVALLLWSFWQRGVIPYQNVPLRLLTPDDWWWGAFTTPRLQEHAQVPYPGAEARVVYNGVAMAALAYAVVRLGGWADVARHLVGGRPQPVRALITAVVALITLVLVLPSRLLDPLWALAVLIGGSYHVLASPLLSYTLYALVALLVLWPCARLGGWRPLAEAALAARARAKADPAPGPVAEHGRSSWPELREAGRHQAADVLTAEVREGRMNDVDCARVDHRWTRDRARAQAASFADTVLREGAAAWTHPSGARDLPTRSAPHDLLAGQVRIGRWVAGERTPSSYGGAGAALGADTLGTSLLAVGPPGSGKTRNLVRPVVESLGLQALTGRCAVVAVCAAGTPLGPDSAYDVVVRLGDPASVHDLDPYAESDDADEAAAFLAEGLAGDLDAVGGRRAATALAQLLGPYRAAHGRFPTLPVLRELLDGVPTALEALRAALSGDEHAAMRRELEARVRQLGAAGDPGPVLADRLALLDRPAFADFFGAAGGGGRPFSLRAVVHHPLRVRIDLPERGHEEASRLITRMVLAQFDAVSRDAGRDHFLCLALDDATGVVTGESVRRIQRLRSRNAGVVLALRTVGDVPEALHGPLYGAVGCRMAFSGVTTWDGGRFADAWGSQWVQTRDVAHHTVFANQPMTRALHALRKLVTGKAVTTEAVTVREVERERWSASELAHSVPPGHAVLSLTSVQGEHAPPLLVDLRA
ncbi:ATP/GTP-binding protein [Streptomyces sp. NPDC048664]|uniref:ATP/GTP-binding protein n=1 Tax=Streptomyces sp. NPDC048664 TaxID=3154505 RepID=UPI0034435C32